MEKLDKTKLSAIFAIVLLMISAFVLVTIPTLGQVGVGDGGSIPIPPGVTPSFEVDTHPFLSFRPNPVGVNQEILVNFWLEPPINVVRYHSNYTVVITDPEGTEVVVQLASYRGDSTGWFPYVVDKIGTWYIQFIFPGSYFPAGNYTQYRGGAVDPGAFYEFDEDCYYRPSSTPKLALEVTDEVVYSWPPAELPTDYWTRPIEFADREWYVIAGNYPWHGPGVGSEWDQLYPDTNRFTDSHYDFLPYREAPETSHIVWRRQGGDVAGIVGGEARRGSNVPMFQMTGDPGTPNIIYAGRCYQTVTKVLPDGTTGSVWQCYDLRTGEVYWEKTDVVGTPNAIEYDEGTGEVPGGSGRAFGDIGYASLIYIGQGRLKKYNPFTGNLGLDVEIPGGLSSGTYYMNCYALSIQNIGNQTNPEYRLINWTTAGMPAGFGNIGRGRDPAIISNVSYARSSLPTLRDFETGYGATYSSINPPQMGATLGTIVRGYNLWTGEELWSHELPTEGMFSGSCSAADHGKVAILFKGGYFKAWDLATGHLAWTSEKMDYPWGEASFGGYSMESAYGLFYRQAYDGIYAFRWDDGTIEWKYEDPALSQYETPYRDMGESGVYSFDSNAWIADGKLYTINNEHTPTPPITRGWGVVCVDAITGDEVWKLHGPWVWGGPGPIADGYLTITSNDGYMYVLGRGQTETTVMAPLTAVPKGTAMTITGSVLDMSPSQPGTPCVSADSMSTQMEYLFFGFPINGIWGNETITGVPVSLTAIGPGGDYTNIGTATTEGYYGTYGLKWTPTAEGTYQILASFDATDAYGSSAASTWVTVGPAPSGGQPQETEEPTTEAPTTEAPTTEAPTTEAPTTEAPTSEVPTTEQPSAEAPAFPTTEVIIVAAVAVAIVIGVGAYWALKRRK
jgi:hypothetical protein